MQFATPMQAASVEPDKGPPTTHSLPSESNWTCSQYYLMIIPKRAQHNCIDACPIHMFKDCCIDSDPTRCSAQICWNAQQHKDDAGSKQAACGYSQSLTATLTKAERGRLPAWAS